jgi:hypothetical protein
VLVDEMQYTGLKRLVVVTGLGAGDSQGTDHLCIRISPSRWSCSASTTTRACRKR